MEHLKIALGEYGIHDIKGIIHNNTILRYFKEIGCGYVKDDETAWCSAFANWVLKKAKKGGTGALNARSFLTYGTPTTKPEIGDIVVLWRIAKSSPYGHVGFFIRETAKKIYILGGNQNDEVNITAFDKIRLLEYRKLPLI